MPAKKESIEPLNFVSLRVFLSHSDKGDLEKESKRVTKAIKDLYLDPLHPKGASPDDVETDYLLILRSCDIIVVILGKKYSLNVEKEFNFAIDSNIDCLLFIKDCKRDKELDKKIKELYSGPVTYDSFNNLKELEKKIKKSIISLLSRRFKSGKKVEITINKLISGGDIRRLAKPIKSGEYLHQVTSRSPFEV